MKRIAAVVVTYNRSAMLMECLDRILHQQGAQCEILVVDNASTDDTRERVQGLGQNGLHYYNCGSNLGGAGGFNVGIRWAVEAGFDRIWVMDDDTYPEAEALSRLVQADERLGGRFGFISSAAFWTDGKGCLMNRPGIHRDYEEELHLLSEGLIRVEQATFVSMYLNASAVIDCGLPIREFFIWGDDVEYSRRMSLRKGYACYLSGASRVIHKMKSNTGSDISIDDPARIDRYRLAYRNEAYLYRQEGIRGRCHYARRCAAGFKRIVFRSKEKRIRRLAALFRGMWEGLFFAPSVEYASVQGESRQ